MNINQTEPVLLAGLGVGGVLTLIEAIFSLSRGLGYLDEETSILWLSFFRTTLPLILGVGAALWARSRVTPVDYPKIITEDGKKVDLVREDGEPLVAELKGISE